MHAKYAYDEDSAGLGLKPVWISGKEAEEVGFDKIRQKLANLNSLRVVIVDNLNIHRPGARQISGLSELSQEIRETCPKITDLDVSRNLFEHWDEVLDICRQLTSLTTLKVEGNRFSHVTSVFQSTGVFESRPFPQLRTLSLDDTLLSWEEASQVCAPLSGLATLSANGNEYASLPDTRLSQTLKSLSLERNGFASFSHLRSLAHLPGLQHLSLKANRMDRVDVHDATFPASLESLDLSYNSISSWSFIDSVGALFPGLRSLRVSHNPLFNTLKTPDGRALGADEGYMLTIARLGRLETLNFSKITAKERLNAEMYYLSLVAKELSSSPGDQAAPILARNPRYRELCELHGDPLTQPARPATTLNERSLAARLALLHVHVHPGVYEELRADTAQSLDDARAFRIELPRSLSIYSVLGRLGGRLQLPPMILRLVWETAEEDGTREERLVPRSRPLGSWIEEQAAVIRVEWDEENVRRRRDALKAT